jgi:hypothetical protein
VEEIVNVTGGCFEAAEFLDTVAVEALPPTPELDLQHSHPDDPSLAKRDETRVE